MVVLSVDGETFEVESPSPGLYHFLWISGPNKDYGFAMQSSDRSAIAERELEDAARDFLEQIDPETGYLFD